MSLSPETLSLLGRAAELRVSGVSWADAANQLAVDQHELRRLASEHHRDYDRLARRARTRVMRETLDDALAALRKQLASPEPVIVQRAALALVRHQQASLRHDVQQAASRLDRDSRHNSKIGAEKNPFRNVTKTTEVPKSQGVDPAKKVTQSTPPATPAAATPPVPPAKPAPTAAKSFVGVDDAARRREHLLHSYVHGLTPTAPITRGDALEQELQRLEREVERIVNECIPEG